MTFMKSMYSLMSKYTVLTDLNICHGVTPTNKSTYSCDGIMVKRLVWFQKHMLKEYIFKTSTKMSMSAQ